MKRNQQHTRRVTLTTHETADLPALILERHVRLGDVDDELAANIPLFKATHISNWEWRGLNDIAKRRGCSLSAVIRGALDAALAAEGITRPEPTPPGRRRNHPGKVRIEIDDAGILHRIVNALRGHD